MAAARYQYIALGLNKTVHIIFCVVIGAELKILRVKEQNLRQELSPQIQRVRFTRIRRYMDT